MLLYQNVVSIFPAQPVSETHQQTLRSLRVFSLENLTMLCFLWLIVQISIDSEPAIQTNLSKFTCTTCYWLTWQNPAPIGMDGISTGQFIGYLQLLSRGFLDTTTVVEGLIPQNKNADSPSMAYLRHDQISLRPTKIIQQRKEMDCISVTDLLTLGSIYVYIDPWLIFLLTTPSKRLNDIKDPKQPFGHQSLAINVLPPRRSIGYDLDLPPQPTMQIVTTRIDYILWWGPSQPSFASQHP